MQLSPSSLQFYNSLLMYQNSKIKNSTSFSIWVVEIAMLALNRKCLVNLMAIWYYKTVLSNVNYYGGIQLF